MAQGTLLQLPAASHEIPRMLARLGPKSLTFYKITSWGPGFRRAVAVIRTHWTHTVYHIRSTHNKEGFHV